MAAVAGDDSVAAGRDVSPSADHGSVAAGVIHGDVIHGDVISGDLTVVQAARPEVARLPVSLPPRPLVLAGREELLATVHGLLGGGGGVRVVVLCGPGSGERLAR